MTISLSDRVENTVGKGEYAGYKHFLLFPQCFPKPSFIGSLKVWIGQQRLLTGWNLSLISLKNILEEKKRKYWLPVFSLFPTKFSKVFFPSNSFKLWLKKLPEVY